MVLAKNRQVILATRPDGIPQAEHFRIVEATVPRPAEGQLVVRNEWLSVEPAMRGWVSAAANHPDPVALGRVMRSFAAGRIVALQHPDWPEGTLVTGMFGWQEFALLDGTQIQRRVDETDLQLSTALGVLGINGVTAHYGLLQIGQPKPGETLVVSTVAGAEGSCVGQIARLHGCHTVGSPVAR